jgi:hypothetical protein
MPTGVKITATKKSPIIPKKVKQPYVVLGFEVNDPSALTEEKVFFSRRLVHNLDVDYGHGFFYVVDDLKGKVVKFFSFGPSGQGKVGWFNSGNTTAAPIKNGYADSRPGTPDYIIKEDTKLFRIMLTPDQFSNLLHETDKERDRIITGKQKYTAWINDTCAEAARDILLASGITTPSGTGVIRQPPVMVFAVSPYIWYDNCVKAGYKEVELKPNIFNWKLIMDSARSGIFYYKDPAEGRW